MIGFDLKKFVIDKEFKHMFKKISGLLLAVVLGATAVLAQDAQLRSLTSGQKYKIKGAVVTKLDDNTFVVRDTTGTDTPSTSRY